jgi:hypothetical protein
MATTAKDVSAHNKLLTARLSFDQMRSWMAHMVRLTVAAITVRIAMGFIAPDLLVRNQRGLCHYFARFSNRARLN